MRAAITLATCLFLASPAAAQQPAVWQPTPDGCEQAAGYAIECVRPSATDPRIKRFDKASYVLASARARPNGQLMLFLAGTHGDPPGPRRLLMAAADAGYRVISLEYNDDVSVVAYCPKRPSPACSEAFRRMRIDGSRAMNNAAIDNTPAEAIVNRLTRLLAHLDRAHPGDGWAGFLADGAPAWGRIAVAGQSQGAGMAALIAKEHVVARVILFSSPWDYVDRGGQRELAPWLASPSRTPPARWFGGYHARENFAALLARSYAALKIPADHIRVFTGELPAGNRAKGDNPFHGQGIGNPAYAADWAFFLRTPAP